MSVQVEDPFGVSADSAMPSLADALDPAEAERQLRGRLSRLTGEDGSLRLEAIRVRRHKPARRCMIEYDVSVERRDAPPEPATVIGKVRVNRFGKSGFRLLDAVWNAGFEADSGDGISVPQPLGTVSAFRMWVQRKVPGVPATELLAGEHGERLGVRIAEAAHKLHRAGVPPERRHTMADEVRILDERLTGLAADEPGLAERLERLLDACRGLGDATPGNPPCGIHRDLYADQLIVDGSRLYLLDFDLYCEGDPAVDIGNFVAHVTEYSLRTLGDPAALTAVEEAIEERFAELSGMAVRGAVRAYATLTLARHVHLSTLHADRRPYTGALLELCEERLGITSRPQARPVDRETARSRRGPPGIVC
jgi:aminoglycoside/choline kinase family phosphotransferase